jgi:serine/threonine protein kinase
MYETLTGTPPFVGGNALATVAKQVREEAPSMRILHAEIPESLDNVVLRCLAKEPLLRYQSACDLLSSLHKVKNGKSVSTPASQAKRQPTNTNSARLSRFAQASPLEWAIAVGVILVFATILTAAIYMAKTAPSLVTPAVQNRPVGQIEKLNVVENQPRQLQKNTPDQRSGSLPNLTRRVELTNPNVKAAPVANGWKQLRQLRVRI